MRNAVVAGHLGKGNLGDEAILRAFVDRHRATYGRVTILTDRDGTSDVAHVRPPTLATGRRFWRGAWDRRRVRQLITSENMDGPIDYVWLGGLLGRFPMHLRARLKELEWAATICDRFVYYFGDVSDGFADQSSAQRLVHWIDRRESWMAVRSAEARRVLETLGTNTGVRVGLDPALYQRAQEWGTPFTRRWDAANAIAIVPCNYRTDLYGPIWHAAARAGHDLGLTIRWVSLSDPDDLHLCEMLSESLASEPNTIRQELYTGPEAEDGIASADLCVATRYHGLIFGVTQGVPTIPVPYASKVHRLGNRLGLRRWIAGPETLALGDPRRIMRNLLESALRGDWKIDELALAEDMISHDAALEEFERSLQSR